MSTFTVQADPDRGRVELRVVTQGYAVVHVVEVAAARILAEDLLRECDAATAASLLAPAGGAGG